MTLCSSSLTLSPRRFRDGVRPTQAFHKYYFELEAGSEPPSASTIVEPRYRVFGDAAVVTYIRLQQRGRATTRTEETRVWRRCAPGADAALGRWRLVHFHRSVPQNAYG